MHPLRLFLRKLVHGVVEQRNPLAFDEERSPEDLMLDRLLIDLDIDGKPRQPIEKRLPVAQRPFLELGRDSLAQLDPERISRGVGGGARGFPQPRDPRVGANDLGEDCLFPEEGLDAELDAALEFAQKLGQLGVTRKQEILDESRAVLEDHAETKGEHGSVYERCPEDFRVPEQVTPLRGDLRRLDGAGQACELAIGNRFDRLSVNACARLGPRNVLPRNPVEIESGRGRGVSASCGGTLESHPQPRFARSFLRSPSPDSASFAPSAMPFALPSPPPPPSLSSARPAASVCVRSSRLTAS